MPIEFVFLDYLQTLHTPLLDELMLFITTMAGRGELALVLGAALLCFKRSRKVGLAIIAAMVIGYLLGSVILKPSIARVRPCNVNLAVEMLVERPHSFSFPSGHTTLAFSAIMALYFAQCRKVFWAAACVGAVVAFSRMYLYVHFPTDILAGLAVGTLSAYIAWEIVRRFAGGETEDEQARGL